MKIAVLLSALLSFLLLAAPAIAMGAPAPAEQKIKIVIHNLSRCFITGINIGGDRKKFEIIYREGNFEHHIFVATRNASLQFYKNPAQYMERLRQAELAEGVTPIIK